MLKRDIKKWDLVLLIINGIIGAGIYGLPSKIFAQSGVYSIFAFLICAIIVFVMVLNTAEVASRFNKTGGPYLYTLTAFGSVPAFIIGWVMLITRLSTYAALINLLTDYLSYFHNIFHEPAIKALIIFLLTLFLTLINYRGVKNSAILSNTFAITKLFTLLIFISVGVFFINPKLIDFQHSIIPNFSNFTSSVLILIFAFSGFESSLVNTGEIQNPKKNIPFALFISILIITVLYILIQVICVSTLPDLAYSDKPLTDAFQIFMGPAGGIAITIGAIISIGGTLNAVMLIGSRIPFALSKAGQFPDLFSYIHPAFRTPINSLITFSAISILVSLTGSFIYAVSISVISKVLIFFAISAVQIKLRLKNPNYNNYFKLRYGYLFGILGILISFILLSSSNINGLKDVIILISIGLAVFSIYKIVRIRNPNK